MNENLNNKYGNTKNIKYLASSLDDLKDIVETVKQMISLGCEKDDIDTVMHAITINAMPLQHSLSSFIISLSVPETLLKSKFHRTKI